MYAKRAYPPIIDKTLHKMTMEGVRVMITVKVKFTLEQATKARRTSRGIALLFL
jgi:hypothetical protein